MKREDIKELYTIDIIDGTLTLIKRKDIDEWTTNRDKYSYVSNILINPKIEILPASGTLNISGLRLAYNKVRNIESYDWVPKPLDELKDGWEDMLFHSDEDIIEMDVVDRKGFLGFNRVVRKGVKFLKAGFYLRTTGYIETQSTSNYRIVGYKEGEVKSRILG